MRKLSRSRANVSFRLTRRTTTILGTPISRTSSTSGRGALFDRYCQARSLRLQCQRLRSWSLLLTATARERTPRPSSWMAWVVPFITSPHSHIRQLPWPSTMLSNSLRRARPTGRRRLVGKRSLRQFSRLVFRFQEPGRSGQSVNLVRLGLVRTPSRRASSSFAVHGPRLLLRSRDVSSFASSTESFQLHSMR